MNEDCTIVKHPVQKHETLMGIALKYDMKIDDLKKLNRLFAGNVFEGQLLSVKVKKEITTANPLARHEPENMPIYSLEYKLSTSVPNNLDLMGASLDDQAKAPDTPSPKHKRSEVWNMLGITKPHEVVTCYAKYAPVHRPQVFGVLTITPTRVIFEPSMEDPYVSKDGLLAHQFSVATDRLLEVEIFLDDVTFNKRLANQLEHQAPWEDFEVTDKKAENVKKSKGKASSKMKAVNPIVHFDQTSEEMLQIVCSGRFRPKNYANFVLPKEKVNVIHQRLVRFLSGSKEERLKACLNLDVSVPRTIHKLRRQHSFSTSRSSDGNFAEIIAGLQAKRKKEDPGSQSLELDLPSATSHQAKLGKGQKKEKKSLKETSTSDKILGSLSERWRRKISNADTLLKPPTHSPITSPPTSPTLPTEGNVLNPSMLELDISDKNPSSPDNITCPPETGLTITITEAVGSTPQDGDEDSDFLPVMRDESLIFKEKDMHQLRRYLPGYSKWLDWKLVYSTQTHGISFSTFLHRTKNSSPTLFILEDSNKFVFGGFATAPWALNAGYFGTGESFLFSLKPKFHVYEWTRTNPYFMLMTPTAIAMGGDKDGRHGFWIDSDFEFGTSEVCGTYFNRCLASTERFKCTIVEVWAFTDNK